MSLLLSLGPVMQQVTGVTPTFFGSITMNREFWAEDPSWSNPGDGNSLTTIRDNGTVASDLTAATAGGGTGPTFVSASTINSKPAFRFNATSATVGGYLSTTSGVLAGAHSIILVVRTASFTWTNRFTDTTSGTGRSIVERIDATSNNWRAYYSSTMNMVSANGAGNNNTHLHVARFKTNGGAYYLDNSNLATDTSGTVSDSVTGWILGSAQGFNACLHGDIAYAAHYDGDFFADSNYTAFTTNIAAYYGI